MSQFQPIVSDILRINVECSPDQIAIIDPEKDQSFTWACWHSQVVRVANSLISLGIRKGDRVGTFLKDSIELPTTLFASSYIGAIFVPMNYRLSPMELSYAINNCGLKLLIFDEDGRPIIERVKNDLDIETYIYTGAETLGYAMPFQTLVEGCGEREFINSVSENDPAMIMYTSGTTGKAKGVVYTHRGVISNIEAWTRPAGISHLDCSIALGPLYHIGPLLSNFMPTVYMGGRNIIQKNFDPIETLRWIKAFNITVMWATPTHLNMIISVDSISDFDMSDLRVIQYSGAPLSSGLFARIRDIFGHIDLVNAYGMTELDAVSAIYPFEHDQRVGSVGRPLPKTFIRIVERGTGNPNAVVDRGVPGEIIVRSPCVMKEYWNLPHKTKEVLRDGWYFTGDLGKVDDEGYLYFVERSDDMIISGGENIYPLEVENFLSKHPKVGSVAVIGTPHDKWGEIVTAFVVRGDEKLTEHELDKYCLESGELARYKRPKKYIFVNSLPTTSSGKIDKKLLRKWVKNWSN